MTPRRRSSQPAAGSAKKADSSGLARWAGAGLLWVALPAAYAAVAAFWFYLCGGRWTDFTWEGYLDALSTPLDETFLAPLSVLHYPWLIVVHGLLLAALLCGAVVVAITHRLVLGLAMAALCAALAHTPLMALALACGCILAARTPLRRELPVLAALLGLLPVGVYFYLTVLSGSGAETVLPIQRWALRAPLVIAGIVSVTAGAIAISVSRWTRVVALGGWLAVVLPAVAGPAMFYGLVGTEELHYQLLTADVGLDGVPFAPEGLEQWKLRVNAEGLGGQTLHNRAESDLVTRKARLIERVDAFLARHPIARRGAEAAWLAAQTESLRLDEDAYQIGLIRYRSWPPRAEARPRWEKLLADCPGTRQAGLALVRLGVLDLRADQPKLAQEHLAKAIELLAPSADQEPNAAATRIFPDPPDLPEPLYVRCQYLTAAQLAWTLEQNLRGTDPNAAKALADWARLEAENLSRVDLRRRLTELAARYAQSALEQNLRLAAAQQLRDPVARFEQIDAIARQRRDVDAAIQASFELGLLLLERPRLGEAAGRTAEGCFAAVRDAPPSPWTPSAVRWLAWIQAFRPAEGANP